MLKAFSRFLSTTTSAAHAAEPELQEALDSGGVPESLSMRRQLNTPHCLLIAK